MFVVDSQLLHIHETPIAAHCDIERLWSIATRCQLSTVVINCLSSVEFELLENSCYICLFMYLKCASGGFCALSARGFVNAMWSWC